MIFLFTQVWIFYFKIFNFLSLSKPNKILILTFGNALFLQASYLKLQLSRSAIVFFILECLFAGFKNTTNIYSKTFKLWSQHASKI